MTAKEESAFNEKMNKSLRTEVLRFKRSLYTNPGFRGGGFANDLMYIRKIIKEYQPELKVLNIDPAKMLENAREIQSRMAIH